MIRILVLLLLAVATFAQDPGAGKWLDGTGTFTGASDGEAEVTTLVTPIVVGAVDYDTAPFRLKTTVDGFIHGSFKFTGSTTCDRYSSFTGYARAVTSDGRQLAKVTLNAVNNVYTFPFLSSFVTADTYILILTGNEGYNPGGPACVTTITDVDYEVGRWI